MSSLQALINSTITANMNFTKTSPKFGQWSDHRANTVYGLGFTSEKDLLQASVVASVSEAPVVLVSVCGEVCSSQGGSQDGCREETGREEE